LSVNDSKVALDMPGDQKKDVVLAFPSTFTLARFILKEEITGVETSARTVSLTGRLSDAQIALACTQYDGIVERMRGK
jgi:hypothetical protein